MLNAVFFPFSEMYINHVKSSEKYDMKIQHYHDAYEIYLQADGERYLFLDDICYTLKQGDLVILKPFDIHYMEYARLDVIEKNVGFCFCQNSAQHITAEIQNISFVKINVAAFHIVNVKRL